MGGPFGVRGAGLVVLALATTAALATAEALADGLCVALAATDGGGGFCLSLWQASNANDPRTTHEMFWPIAIRGWYERCQLPSTRVPGSDLTQQNLGRRGFTLGVRLVLDETDVVLAPDHELVAVRVNANLVRIVRADREVNEIFVERVADLVRRLRARGARHAVSRA